MRENLGTAVYKFRINKGMKQKDLSDERISLGQISNIETGLQIPSAEKFMILLDKLNVVYEEFIFMMDDEYLTSKTMMDKQLAEFVKRQNTNGLKELAAEASDLFKKYSDVYFFHIKLMSLAMSELISSNNDYYSAKSYLKQIKEYLDKIDEWGYYELTLITNCLFMFEIEIAISFGERALKLIKKNYSFYKDEDIGRVLLNNLAIYTLDYEPFYNLTLKFCKMSIRQSLLTNDATRAIKAKIIYQIVSFKLANGLYKEKELLSLLNVFKLLEWHKEYIRLVKFIRKHGIKLPNLK